MELEQEREATAAAAASAEAFTIRRAAPPNDGPRRRASTPGANQEEERLRLTRLIFVRPTGIVAATRAAREDACAPRATRAPASVCGCAMDTDAMVDPCAFAGCPSARGFEHFMLEHFIQTLSSGSRSRSAFRAPMPRKYVNVRANTLRAFTQLG